MTVPVGIEEIVISSPGVQSVTVYSERGRDGQRGTMVFSGVGHPTGLTSGTNPYYIFGTRLYPEDYYLRLDNNRIYKYFNDIGGAGWSETSATNSLTLTTPTIDFSKAYFQKFVVAANTTFTATGTEYEQSVRLILTNDSGSSRTLTWPNGWKWSGSAPASINNTTYFQIELVNNGGTIFAVQL